MNETESLRIQLSDGTTVECSILLSDGPPSILQFSGIDIGVQEFADEDLFEVLCAFREGLEKIGAQVLCAGARPDVFPSGMSRSMSNGRKAYRTRLGAPALRTDLVDIFDYAEPEAVGSVAQQRTFHSQWIQSLRQ